MKKKHEKRLDILDSIDDDIIDKHTKKRHDLSTKQRKKPRWVLAMAACLALLVVASSFLILPRLWQDDSKQIPVYQGMSISSEKQAEAADLDELEFATLSLNSWYANSGRIELLDGDVTSDTTDTLPKPEKPEKPGNNGNHFGQNKKPIKDVAEESLKVDGAVEIIYYAEPNQDIYITIHVSNPDNFEILSFTLNEKKYSSYMFEEGSDMENLILKVNVGDVEGMVEYTIDAIKYVDGTEIKDVVMEGDKTVQCGVYSEKQPTAEVTNEVVGINKLTLTVNITDPLNLIGLCGGKVAFVLSDGEQLVAIQELAVGEEAVVTVDTLLTDSDYEYAIAALYDPLDGDGMRPIVLLSKQIHTKEVVAFDNVTATQSGVTFAYVWNDAFENKVLTSAVLYKDDEKLQELALDATSVEGLLSDNAYSIVITYVNMGETETVTLDFTTKAKTVPTLSLEKGEVKQESFVFTLTYTDPDSVGAVTKIELLHGEDAPIVAENVDARAFANLLSDNEYTVRVTVTYDLNDGTGEKSFNQTLNVKTKAKTVPSVKFSDTSVTKNSFAGTVKLTDSDSVLRGQTIMLYQNSEKVLDAEWTEILAFEKLTDYTDYKVVVEYTYDLNDGNGVQTKADEHVFKTAPHIDVTGVSVRNTSALFEGETIFLQATLDNPHDATITALTVNGKRYQATSFSTTSLFEITVDESLGSGAVDLTVESVMLTLDGKSYTVACDTLCSDDVFINGKFEFLGWDFVNAAHEEINVLIPGEETYFRIKLNNPTDYAIDSVTVYGDRVLNGDDLIKIDQNTYLCPVTFVSNEEPDGAENAGLIVMMYGYGSEDNAMQVHSLSYSNEYVNSTLDQVEDRYRSVYVLRSNEIRKISSVEDLYTINESIRYELTCNIDLAGVEWKSVPFRGSFNGNGYAIKNMSFVGTVNDVNGGVSLGLFSSAIGLIENLHIENAFTFVTTSTKEVVYGAIAARADGLVLKNCSVDAASSVLITTSSYGYIGGLVGASFENTVIDHCVNHSAISVNVDSSATPSSHIGGIVGFVWENCSVVSCVNYGTIRGEGVTAVGGIAGGNSGSIKSCMNYGTINCVEVDGSHNYDVDEYVGGIAGWNSGTVSNCTNTGEVNGSYNKYDEFIGGIVGYNDGGTVSNCSNSGNVNGNQNNNDEYVGGIVGYNDNGTVINCTNTGNMNGGIYAGGIAGYNDGQGAGATISNCINRGEVSAKHSGGGIVGYNAGGTVSNCINTGNVSCDSDYYGGGIVGGCNDLSTNRNCYATKLYKWTVGKIVTMQTLAEKSFWTETLDWDEAIWNFDDLDPSSGKYPTLR